MNTRQLLTDKLPVDIVDHVIMPYVQNTKEHNKQIMNDIIEDIQTSGTDWNARQPDSEDESFQSFMFWANIFIYERKHHCACGSTYPREYKRRHMNGEKHQHYMNTKLTHQLI